MKFRLIKGPLVSLATSSLEERKRQLVTVVSMSSSESRTLLPSFLIYPMNVENQVLTMPRLLSYGSVYFYIITDLSFHLYYSSS